MEIIKKNGLTQAYNFSKIKHAVTKSAKRVNVTFSDAEWNQLEQTILKLLKGCDKIPVERMHNVVEIALDSLNDKVAVSYKTYRNYKVTFADMMTKVLLKADEANYKIDRSNANTTAALVSTKRSLIYGALNKERYKKFELTDEQVQAIEDGYIYIHDMTARADTYNCCLFNMGRVLAGGFYKENMFYTEAKTIRAVFGEIKDTTLDTAAQQYGGFTIPEIDSILAPYARKSFNAYVKKYYDMRASEHSEGMTEYEKMTILQKAKNDAMNDLVKDIEQGFQALEYAFNTVASSRGDFPFVTLTGGCEEDPFGQLVWKTALRVRREGQGQEGNKRPAIFPKLVFLYTKELHAPGKPLYDLYKEGVITSSKTMYPDWLSLDMPDPSDVKTDVVMQFKPAIAEVFHKYHKFGVSHWLLNEETGKVYENPEWVDAIVSPMGCRAYLSPLYESGHLKPVDENDKPQFLGRFNGGAVSLNLPMIYMKAKEENKDFYEVLDYYLNMINDIHISTYEFLSSLKASCNPVAFCQGGFGTLNPNDNIKPLVDKITFSYGFTALNELEWLAEDKSLYAARNEESFALKVLQHITNYVDTKKKEREAGIVPYIAAIYATPAESLCGTQVEQFVAKYGKIKHVSDKPYFTNSFHMWVGEEITPFEKQDAEYNYFHLSSGGHIQYCRFPNGDNLTVIDKTIRRAMQLGYYFGVNIESSYCGDCGCKVDDAITVCPFCGSHNITTINRVCGYLGYSYLNGDTKMNDAKLAEVADRKSM